MREVGLVILAYLIGSIPTALIISKKYFGVDIRDYGSGNMGATNTFRVLGKKYGTIVMVIDIIKGVLASSLYIFVSYYNQSSSEWDRTTFIVCLGISAVLGHIFPIFANFKGGKGVATLCGMLLALQPTVALCCLAVFLTVLYLTRFVSLSSILAALALPVFVLLVWKDHVTMYRIFAIAVALMVILTHQKNIGRLLKGIESKIPILKYRDKRKARRRNQ